MSLLEQQPVSEEPTHGVSSSPPSRRTSADLTAESSDSFATAHEEGPPDAFVDMDDDQCMIAEATVLDARELKTKEVTIEPPTVPQRSSLRASKLLKSLRLDTIQSTTQSLNTTSHEMYLSSEEDASSFEDGFSSDYDYSSSDESEQSPVRRKSHEDTARAVSVIYVGKPSIVNLAGSRHSTPAASKPRPQTSLFGRPSSATLARPSSASLTSKSSRISLPPRQSSLPQQLASMSYEKLPTFPRERSPSGSKQYKLEGTKAEAQPGASPRLSRSPGAAYQRFQRSINLVRKSSWSNLKAAAAEASPSPSSGGLAISIPSPATSPIPQEQASVGTPATVSSPISPATPRTPVTYNEILRVAKKNSSSPLIASFIPPQALPLPATPTTPSTKKGILGGFVMTRRKSIKIRS
ncbi:hypothetical protein F4780DRAFT_87647 [Xylariomycetidae sp. FL0641]|nr:hypothetical protein F4780DRAFT_87647 [Xylariomycetidae sp. FL0641]